MARLLFFPYKGAGSYTLSAIVTDGNYSSSNVWTITATAYPIAATFNGATTNLSAIPNLAIASGVVIEKTAYGKIEFTTPVDLSTAG